MQVQHVPASTIGQVWRVTGNRVQRVLIRAKPSEVIWAVSAWMRDGPVTERGAYTYRTAHCPITDLYQVEQDAHLEFRRRRALTHDPANRRRRCAAPVPGAPSAIDGVLIGLAIGLTCIMAVL